MISKYDQEFAVSVFVVSRVGESEHAASAVVLFHLNVSRETEQNAETEMHAVRDLWPRA